MSVQAKFTCVVWLLLTWAQVLAVISASEPDEAASKAAVRESFKFDPDERLVLVPVRIGAKEYRFVVDTGASASIFDASLRRHLGPHVDTMQGGTPCGREVEMELYGPPNANVGSLRLTKSPVACHDLTAFRERSGYDIYGFLGMEFLKDWIITIDFDEGRLYFLAPGTARNPKWGEDIPCVYDATGMLRICGTVGKETWTSFMVDTGFAGTGSLEDALLCKLAGSHEVQMTGDTKGVDMSGISSPQVTRLSHLSLGSFEHQNLRLTSGAQNALGAEYLRRYRVTFDFPNERIYLAKGKRFEDRDRGYRCGLGVLFRSGRIEFTSVDEKGPAHAAGVRAKDVVVEACGKPVSKLKPSEVYNLLTTEGKPVRMIIERNGKRMEITFTPKEYD